jgi:NAD(P)-dependent dehydrogenase (short-subunit alcohol dehydrogenase family)
MFENKIALVTGGSSGIGLGIAKELRQLGARVIITGRNEAKLAGAAQEIGAGTSWVTVNVTRVSEVQALFDRIKAEHGHLDIVVANAGGGTIAPIGQITEEQVDSTFGTNVKGVICTVQGALPLMRAGGSVAIIGSTASFNPAPGMSVYGASKAAVRNLVRAWIQEIRGSGVRINVVSPGPVHTDSLESFFPADQKDAAFEFMNAQSTVGRIGTPADIAKAVVFLAGESSGYINGIEFFVDGGASQI